MSDTSITVIYHAMSLTALYMLFLAWYRHLNKNWQS